MATAKNVKKNIELTREEELTNLKSQKSWTADEMERILTIEKEILAENFEVEKAQYIDETKQLVTSSKILKTKKITKGKAIGMTVISH